MLIAKSNKDIHLFPRMANRHGIISGATGSGKTVTLQTLAENFSKIGVPVFMADVKGDLAGLCTAGENTGKIKERIEQLNLTEHVFKKLPVTFWDIYGKHGHPARATVSSMGATLLSRLLDLNEVQSGTMVQLFRISKDYDLPLIKLRDITALAQYVINHTKDISSEYGSISTASIGTIQRSILVLEDAGVSNLFGEPSLNISDFMVKTGKKGNINILSADNLISNPKVYSMFLLWLLNQFYSKLPEAGDLSKPKFVFFFDEAHLLFDDAPKVLVEKIEQIIRLIRSKAVGIYFVTQNPTDIPSNILSQCGNRIQHALRSYTPNDHIAIKLISKTFRSNPNINVETAITELKTGEALVSLLDDEGTPGMVERALIVPPGSQVGPVSLLKRLKIIEESPIYGCYENEIYMKTAHAVLSKAAQINKEKEQYKKHVNTKPKRGGKQEQNISNIIMSNLLKTINKSFSGLFKI